MSGLPSLGTPCIVIVVLNFDGIDNIETGTGHV